MALASDWVTRFIPAIRSGGTVLDLAAGSGRHTRALLAAGHPVVSVDQSVEGLADLTANPKVAIVVADLEDGPWPFPGRRFAGIVVANYLHRPLLPLLADSLTEGGILIYETFAVGNEQYGRPQNPEFLLKPRELIDVFGATLTIVAYEQGLIDRPSLAVIQRIVAVNARGPVHLRRSVSPGS